MAKTRPNPASGKLRLQRLALWVEQVWGVIQRPLLVVLFTLTVVWSGWLMQIPKSGALFNLGIAAVAFVVSLRPLLKTVWPSRYQVARTLEQKNQVAHRAVSSGDDVKLPDSGSEELWQAHVESIRAKLTNLSVASPRSSWRSFDPLALRLPVVMAACAAFILGTGELRPNLIAAFSITAAAAVKSATLDAWIKPPAYTGKPPFLLSSAATLERLKANPELSIPENSVLSLRFQGSTKPEIQVLSPGYENQAVKLAEMKVEDKDGQFTVEAKLDRPITMKVLDASQVLASWQFVPVTDLAPTIEIVDEPKGDSFGKLSVKWHAADDYGVKSVSAVITLADEQDKDTGFESTGVFLYLAPEFKIAMAKPNAKDDTETSTADLASHPWAGLWAEITLTATDAAGHTTATQPKRFRMPERDFIMPLARAFAEQRKRFVMSPDDAPDASTMISAMLLYPFELSGRFGLQSNIAALNSRLAQASHPDDVVAATKDFWPLILAVEDGSSGDPKTRLKQLANQLRQAMREGAPKERIDELMKKLGEEMNKLAQQMQKEGKQQQADGAQPQTGPSVTPQQLQDMLDQIGKLGEQGNTDRAEQMLSQLDQMLQNLQPGQGQMAQGGAPGQGPMDGLSGLLGKQQKLMDETQRLGKDGNGNKPGQNGKQGEGSSAGDLGDKQKSLRNQLDKLGKGLSPEEGGDKFGEAGKNMGDAEDALRRGNKDEALRQQNKAMRNMLQGMGKLAEQMGKGGDKRQGSANGDGNGRKDDPLGRPQGPRRPDVGESQNIVPSDIAKRKARAILEELRGRANEQGLDIETKGYINGLLQGLE